MLDLDPSIEIFHLLIVGIEPQNVTEKIKHKFSPAGLSGAADDD